MKSDTVISVQSASKKYCRSLKRSLWYGVRDMTSEVFGRDSGGTGTLRKDEFWSVRDISFELKRGECLGLIGPNGAGKSTLLKMLNGLIRPDAGQIEIRGRMSALIELGAGFNPVLTGRENVFVNASVLGMSKKETQKRLDDIVDFAGVADFIDSPVQNYSSGMKVRLGFAVASKLDPDILLIDEVLAVGDVGFRMKCFQHLLDLNRNGTSIIFVTHTMNDLVRISSRSIVLDKGKAVYDGDVNVAIGTYHNLLLVKQDDNVNESNVASIESVTMIGTNGVPRSEFRTGETVGAEIVFQCTEPVKNPRVILAVESPGVGELGSVATPGAGFEFELAPPRTSVRVYLPDIPLLVGGYSLTVSLYGSGIRDFYDRKLSAAQFMVTGPPIDAFGFGVCGKVHFQHKWDLVP